MILIIAGLVLHAIDPVCSWFRVHTEAPVDAGNNSRMRLFDAVSGRMGQRGLIIPLLITSYNLDSMV